jgi:Ca-activated chloride channel family protein
MVSVIAFDTHVLPLVAPTVLGELSRPKVVESIRSLATGTDTCISCGIEAALGAFGAADDLVNRILLLSDGEANVAVRDVAGFAGIGRAAQNRDVSISTIGVGVDYNERILSALSRESNGRHYYADRESSLPRIFDAETTALGGVVAAGLEARLELAPGVELLEMLDRAHRVEGRTVVVPLGQLSRGEKKTALLRVAVDRPAGGPLPLCRVEVAMRGGPAGGITTLSGEIATVASEGADVDDLDPAVEVRLQRSATAGSLLRANELFSQGNPKGADLELGVQTTRIEEQSRRWAARRIAVVAPLLEDLEDQARSLRDARGEYRSAAAARPAAVAAKSVPARANARMRAMEAFDMAL